MATSEEDPAMKLLYALAFICAICAPAYADEIAIGDSIAVGLGLPGSAKIGIGPEAVLERIRRAPYVYGDVVILSTGLSNDPTASDDLIAQQIVALQTNGAHVILLGVGEHVPNLWRLNEVLGAHAARAGIPFVYGWPEVHPPSYPALLRQVREVECNIYKVCGA